MGPVPEGGFRAVRWTGAADSRHARRMEDTDPIPGLIPKQIIAAEATAAGASLAEAATAAGVVCNLQRRDPAEGGRGRHADNRIRRGGGVEVNRATRGRSVDLGRRPCPSA